MKIRKANIETNKTARGTRELELSNTIINPMKRENNDTSHKMPEFRQSPYEL